MVVNAELNRKVPPQQRILGYLSVTVLTTFIHLCNSDKILCNVLHLPPLPADQGHQAKISETELCEDLHKMSATPGCGCSSRNVQNDQQLFIGINIIAFTFFFTSGGSLSKDMMAFYKEQNKFSFARSLLSLVICTQLKLLLGQKSQTMRGSL